jgi:hypothetical protein
VEEQMTLQGEKYLLRKIEHSDSHNVLTAALSRVIISIVAIIGLGVLVGLKIYYDPVNENCVTGAITQAANKKFMHYRWSSKVLHKDYLIGEILIGPCSADPPYYPGGPCYTSIDIKVNQDLHKEFPAAYDSCCKYNDRIIASVKRNYRWNRMCDRLGFYSFRKD